MALLRAPDGHRSTFRRSLCAANTLLRNQVLFGSDFPMLTPERWIKDLEQIEIRDEVRPLIMKDNAIRALKLR